MGHNILSEVLGHDIYKHLIKDLPDEDRQRIEAVIKRYVELLESNLIDPLADLSAAIQPEKAEDESNAE